MRKSKFGKGLVVAVIVLFIGASVVPSISGNFKKMKDESGSVALDNSLIGCWHFDEGSGDIAYDSSGHNNNGTIYSASWVGGISGKALWFDGNDDYVRIHDTDDFEFVNQSFTFFTWVKILNNADEWRIFICLGDIDGPPVVYLGKSRSGYADGRIIFRVFNSAYQDATCLSVDDGDALPKNQWMHVAGVANYESNLITLYVNGNVQESQSLVSLNLSEAQHLRLLFGNYSRPDTTYEHHHYGPMDEVHIYNRALNDTEILEYYEDYFPISTVYVDDDYNESTPGWGYDHFDNIQDGIDAVNESGTVFVFNGTYYENVDITKDGINLIGEDKNTTIIDASGSGDVVYVSADWVNITGFSMRNSGSSPFQDAGLDISSSSNCNVEDCLFFNNGYAGIQVFSASDCQLVKCHVYQNRAGMFILNSNNIQILDCICNNTGNGIRVDSAGCWNVNIVNCTTYNNIGSGIIFIQGASNNNVVGCISYNNSYGISFYKSGTTNNNCFNCTIFENTVGIRCNRSADNNLIYHNNLINNIMNAVDECNNTWNDSYPSCGNYWDDYTDNDLYSGPNQDIPGSDGIGDTPYNLSGGDNQDMYPCMEPNGWINSPPNIPDRPSGEVIVLPGVEHTYTTSTIDPDSDSIWFKWDWGDGTYTDWLGPYDSGEEASATASWSQGTYQIRVKAKDNRNPETEWSESLTVNIIYPNFKTVFLFGQISNLNESSELSSFNAVKLLWINFNPIFPQILTSNETIVVSNKYFGILRPSFIFGFFNAMVLT